jgi:two-component system LytT family sensor kinase
MLSVYKNGIIAVMFTLRKIGKLLFRCAIHVLFWIVVYFFYNYFLGYGSENTEYVTRFSLFLMPATVVVSYVFLLYLIPKYLLVNKQGLFILYSIYTLIISYFFISISILYGSILLAHLRTDNSSPLTKTFLFIVLGVYFVVFIVIAIGLLMNNFKSIVKNEDLKNKILQTQLQLKEQELKLLKMQIHPHFLFNSLNTIYGFALKKADEAPEMILKLSNLLDYILYQIEKPTVSLENEINHLEDYISLEKLRFHDTLQVNLMKEDKIGDVYIAPMLLIPFVENSFKHGAIVDGCLSIHISIKRKNNTLIFDIENSLLDKTNNSTGIGLDNIQKRLKMLYPNAHTLQIDETDHRFKVSLTIDINGLKNSKNVNES